MPVEASISARAKLGHLLALERGHQGHAEADHLGEMPAEKVIMGLVFSRDRAIETLFLAPTFRTHL